MFEWLFGKKSNIHLGVDLGSSSIKIVEFSREEERFKISNYALAQAGGDSSSSIFDMDDEEIIALLTRLIDEAKIKSRQAAVSLPVEKTFSTLITLPAMPEQELVAAVSFEAQKYVPVPLNEVVLEWTIIGAVDRPNIYSSSAGRPATDIAGALSAMDLSQRDQGRNIGPDKRQKIAAMSAGTGVLTAGNVGAGTPGSGMEAVQILLLAVPKEIIARITRIMAGAGLKVAALEQEAFSLARSLIGNDKNIFMIADLGRTGTDIIVLDGGFIKMTHNLDSINKEIILMEIDRVANIFQMRYNKKIGQCLLAGGRANEKELFDFLAAKLKMPLKIGNPFSRVIYDKNIEGFLKELAPQFSVAAGLAMRE